MADPRKLQCCEEPLDLLTNRNLIQKSFISQIWGPVVLGSLTFVGVCVANWYTRRPYFSGIQKHILLSGGAAYLGKFLEDYRDDYFAERDAVLRHYVQLHPEDFPPLRRKKFSEVLIPWVPIR